jgi:hypothetical protein
MAVTDDTSRIATKTRQAQGFFPEECKAVGEPWADEVIE